MGAHPHDVSKRAKRYKILEVDEKLHHLCDNVSVSGLGLPVHGPSERQTMDATSQIRPGDHVATEVEKSLLRNGNVFIKMSLHTDPERVGHKSEIVIEIERVDKL